MKSIIPRANRSRKQLGRVVSCFPRVGYITSRPPVGIGIFSLAWKRPTSVPLTRRKHRGERDARERKREAGSAPVPRARLFVVSFAGAAWEESESDRKGLPAAVSFTLGRCSPVSETLGRRRTCGTAFVWPRFVTLFATKEGHRAMSTSRNNVLKRGF